MPQTSTFVSQSDVEYRETVNKVGERRRISTFFPDKNGPMGFLMLVPERNQITTHFHRVNQFQVLFPSDGARYRRTPIDDVLVHYADGYATYGPITTTVSSLEMFTLRAIHDDFRADMPAEREKLVRRGKRNLHGSVASTLTGSSSVESLFEDGSDGLFAGVARTGPGGSISTIDASGGGGQYHCILSGTAQLDGKSYVAKSLLWMTAGDAPRSIVAGSEGLVLLTVQFPVGSREIDGQIGTS